MSAVDQVALSALLWTAAGVAPDGAARELAGSWNDGDLEYQTVADLLGDWLTDDEPRPKLIADDLAAYAGLALTD